jgi:hypothetical protein
MSHKDFVFSKETDHSALLFSALLRFQTCVAP